MSKPLTAVEVYVDRQDIDNVLWGILSIYIHALKTTPVDDKLYSVHLSGLAKLAVDIKKSKATSLTDKEALLKEVAAYLKGTSV